MSRVLLLTGSIALNGLCLVAFVLVPASVPPPVHDFLVRHFSFGAERAAPAPKPATPKPAVRKTLWPSLDAGGDLKTLAGRLRAAGFPPEVIRAMIMAELNSRFAAKMRAISEPDGAAPFWKQPSNFYSSGDKRMEEYSRLGRERAKLQRELFSDPFFSTDDVTAEQRRKFGNLSRQKIDLLTRIEEDYSEMFGAIRSGTNGILLAEDREKMALLQRERRADLAGVLSPEELADYEVRSSQLTSMLVRQLGNFNASEAEFRAIFQAQQAFGEKIGPVGGASINMEDRRAASQQLNDQLKAALGPARYADYVRETDRGYQQLARLAERDKLPSDTAVRAFNVRDTVAAESGRIADDPALSLDQKRAALQQLAERTRTQILGLLGPTAGPTYVQVVDQQWLNIVARGNAISFDGSNNMMTYTSGGSSGLPVTASFGIGPSFRGIGRPPSPPPVK